MTRDERATMFREVAAKASPRTAAIFREIAARHDQEDVNAEPAEPDYPRSLADYMRPVNREPGEEG